MILMTNNLSNSSLLHCRLLETSLGCSITIEYEKIEWQEDIQCIIRFHGRHCLSSMFPIEITRDGRIQTNFVYKDVGEIMAIGIELLSNKDIGLYIKWIEISIPRKSYLQRFDVQRWLHSNIGDGRTRLILTPNQLPGYVPKRMLENIEQPKRDNVKYMLLIEISQAKGNVDGSMLSIDLIGKYGRTSAHRINMKYNTIIPLEIRTRPNIFELTMLDIGLLYEYQIKLENNKHNDGAYFLSTMYIYRKQYYEVNIQQWIENDQTLNGHIRLLDMPITSTLFNQVQSKSSFILWITGSDLITKEITLPIEFKFNCQNTIINPVEETITIRADFVSVLALSTTCIMPLNSITLGYNRKLIDYCIGKEIVILNVFQGQHFYFQYDNELPKSINDMDFYSFTLKKNVLSSVAHHSKQYVISMLTSENNLSEKHTIKIVLRGERGLTTMLSLHNSSWNKIPFRPKHKDKFLLLASDIGKIIGLTIFHASEEAKFNFDIIEIFVPDTKACIRLDGKYEIFSEIIDFNCQESQIVYIVQIKSGFSTLNETADIILTLIGEESSIEWILLTCDDDTKPFRTGQLDTFYIPTKRLGKIRAVNISCSNVNSNCKWFCEMIYVHDTVFNIKSNYIINRWCGDYHESDFIDTLNTTSKTTLIQPASTKLLTTFLMTIKSGIRTITNPSLTPSIYVFFAGQFGSSPIIHLNELTDRMDLFQSLEIDEFSFTIPDTGMPDTMRIWNTEDLAPWTCEYIDIKNINNSKTVHFPMGVDLQKVDSLFPSYIDLEVDIGRVTLSLPGPRNDAAYPSYQLIIRTKEAINTKDSLVNIQIKGDKNQSKLIPLIESDNDYSFETEKTSTFFLYGICSLGELKEISIYFDGNHTNTKWICEYIIIYDYLNNQYYGTKINTDVIYGKYKLGIIKNIDPKNLNQELDRIETELIDEKVRESDPIYRILYKTQANVLTNITRNAEILIRLVGDESTSFFPLEHNRPLISGSINESFYRGNEYINGLNKIDLQLLDNDNTRWACESIEIQNLLTDDIVIFPINDIIEATIKTDITNKKITTWKSGFKSGIVYFIRVRTGYQGASLNFRFGSVYLSLKLYGDSGVSNEISLRIPLEQLYYLKCNQTDTFEIGQMISVVGQITSIDIYHNGKKEDFWHINWINITDITTNKSFHFTIEKYLNKDLGTNSKVLHIPADISIRKSENGFDSIPNYAIRIKTGTQTPLHTEETNESSAVSIVLIDPVNDSVRIPLKRINSSVRSIFQPGQEDRFDVTIIPMLELKVLQIYFNGTFPWFCERITVIDQISGLSYRFDVEQWFIENTYDNPINIFGQREDDIGWIYFVTVKTQAVLPVQTSLRGKILLSIYGEYASLNDAILGSGRLMHGLFHAGGEDIIELKSNKRLGEINSIELHLEVAEWQSWLCDMIEIIDSTANWDFLSRTMITKTYKFPINRWLGAHAMDKRTVIHSLINQEPGYAKMPTYIIHILTGTKNMNNESDIPINVYLQLFCTISNNVYGPILLDKSSNNTQPFRKGQIDEFYINDLSYCGEIKKIRLWHDGGKTISWHCEWIKITNVHKNEIYEFSVEKILDEDLEEGSSNLILYSEKKDEMNESELATPQSIIS
ncbi:unnamed protein product [Rotaria sordida]|uniref:PLAT domain-containing protein n=1 Tax=Rotaria sordida TaxID=392033 RepID=A0A819DIN8_9BILA|nr:unnamed protein product [Rotaria sordida]